MLPFDILRRFRTCIGRRKRYITCDNYLPTIFQSYFLKWSLILHTQKGVGPEGWGQRNKIRITFTQFTHWHRKKDDLSSALLQVCFGGHSLKRFSDFVYHCSVIDKSSKFHLFLEVLVRIKDYPKYRQSSVRTESGRKAICIIVENLRRINFIKYFAYCDNKST